MTQSVVKSQKTSVCSCCPAVGMSRVGFDGPKDLTYELTLAGNVALLIGLYCTLT